MSHLSVRELSPHRFDQAFPLARAVLPCLTLEAWRGYLGVIRRQARAGLLAVENERGVLLGLAGYRWQQDPQHGACLDCDPVVVFELVAGERVAQALIEALERQARHLGCDSLHTTIALPSGVGLADPLPDTALLRSFSRQGHRIEATRLCKKLEPPAALN